MVSIVVYMSAPQESVGAMTKGVPGLAVRMTIADEVLEDGLDVFYEILGGTIEQRNQIINHMQEQYRATIKVNQDRLDAWRATVCFTNVTALLNNPFFRSLLEARFLGDRVVLVYQDGVAIFRLDLPDEIAPDQITELATSIGGMARQLDPGAIVRVGDLARELEDWEPLDDYRPAP